MINLLKVRKMIGQLFIAVIPWFIFIVFTAFKYPFLVSVVGFMFGLVLMMIVYNMILYKHPMLSLIEGKGLLVLSLDSTGIIQPYIVGTDGRKVGGKIKNRFITSVFDRGSMTYLKNPLNATMEKGVTQTKNEGNTKIVAVPEGMEAYTLLAPIGDKNTFTYSFNSFPTLIFNNKLDSFISKDDLANMELEGTIKHVMTFVKNKVEDLNNEMKNFSRYVVEMSRPKQSRNLLGSPWFWIILLIGGAVMFFVFGGDIVGSISQAADKTQNALVVS